MLYTIGIVNATEQAMTQVYTFDSNIVSDLHKDAYGFRPNELFWSEWLHADDDVKQRIWDDLLINLDAEIKREQEEQDRAIVRFEDLIAQTIRSGAKDRTAAVRWIFEAGRFYDYEEMEFRHNLPFNYLKKIA